MVRIVNASDRPRGIQAFPFCKWDLANYAFNAVESNFAKLFNETSVEEGIIFATTRFWNITTATLGNPNTKWDKWAFMSSSAPDTAFECFDEEFVGKYRDYRNPIAIERGYLNNSKGGGRDIIGAFQHEFTLQPGEEQRFVVIVGIAYDKQSAIFLRDRYNEWEEAERGLAEVNHYWDHYLSEQPPRHPARSSTLLSISGISIRRG